MKEISGLDWVILDYNYCFAYPRNPGTTLLAIKRIVFYRDGALEALEVSIAETNLGINVLL